MTVRVYDNGDHTAIAWLPTDGQTIPGCRGFAIKRNHNGAEDFLHSFVGFHDNDLFPKDATWQWPLQRYMWWDYFVKPGDTVSYQVIPVLGSASNLQLHTDLASDWTANMTVTGQCTSHMSAYFNKGIVASQWVSRELDAEAKGQNRQSALKAIIQNTGDPLRDALGGPLKAEVIKLLNDAKGGRFTPRSMSLTIPNWKLACSR